MRGHVRAENAPGLSQDLGPRLFGCVRADSIHAYNGDSTAARPAEGARWRAPLSESLRIRVWAGNLAYTPAG
eukprot:352785-Chlamydomonas_euryale.AAC.1